MPVDNVDLEYPCTLCMGFCDSNHSDSLVCRECKNSFHQHCAKLTNINFERLKLNNDYICPLCQNNQKTCETCNCINLNSQNSLYCVTCRKITCDDCNDSTSSQIHCLRTTAQPFYCSLCSLQYPCLACGKHCYNDTAHDASIMCDICKKMATLQML